MAQPRSQKRSSFVVRFLGDLGQDQQAWRGEVEHVQSGEKRPFQGASQLLRILANLSVEQIEKPRTYET